MSMKVLSSGERRWCRLEYVAGGGDVNDAIGMKDMVSSVEYRRWSSI